MQHMAKGNFFNIKNFLFLFTAYLCLLAFDSYVYDDHGIKNRITESKESFTRSNRSINGLIFGGSNSMWGISAKQLSAETDIDFYNFSMPSNGFNYLNYFKYIDSSLSTEQKINIDYIIWSTIHPLDLPPYDDFTRDISGKLNSIKHGLNLSLSQHFKNIFLLRPHRFLHDKNTGDFLKESFKCPASDLSLLDRDLQDAIFTYKHKLQIEKEFEVEFNAYNNYIKSNFPNAKVLFVVPSTFNEISTDKETLDRLNLLMQDAGFQLFLSSPLRNMEYICDASHHPSILGRKIRSEELSIVVNG